jgi:hypothetical protein
VNYGVSAEVRSLGATQDKSRNTNTLYWHSAVGYISSDKFGKFEVGTPNDAIDQLGVGSGDDYGTGGFYSEYGWPNATNFIASDSYDGDNPHQKLAYISPAFAGFTFAVSYQPTAVGLNNSSSLFTYGQTNPGAASKDRIEGAVQFSHAFGPTSVKADVGYAWASPDAPSGSGYKDVNYVQAGAVATLAGFELEGQVNTGKFSVAGNDAGNWGGPLKDGAKDTTAWIVGVGYTTGPYSIGAQYYHLTADASDNTFGAGTDKVTGTLGKSYTGEGEALGAGYVVGPGVSTYLDAITDQNKLAGRTFYGTGVGVGVYFSW